MSAANRRLEEMIADHGRFPLPGSSSDPELDDICGLLVLYEGRVTGVARSVLAGAPIDRSDLEPDAALASRIAAAASRRGSRGADAVLPYEEYRQRLDALLDASRLALDSRLYDR